MMLPRQTVTERRRNHQSDGKMQAISFSLSASNVLLKKFDVKKNQKVCTVKIQVCLPSCRSESSNIQLGQIRQTGYKESVCYMISPLIFYFYRKKKHQWSLQSDGAMQAITLSFLASNILWNISCNRKGKCLCIKNTDLCTLLKKRIKQH